MAPATNPLCSSHEERLSRMEENSGDLKADIARIDQKVVDVDEKLEVLSGRVAEGFSGMHARLDHVCGVLEKATKLEAQVTSLEKSRRTYKRWGWKLGLPVCLLLCGSAAGVHGPKLIHLIVAIFGG